MKHTKNPTRKALLFSILILFLIVLGYKLYKLVSFPLLLKDTHITIEIGEPFHPEENIKAVLFGDKNSVKEKGKITSPLQILFLTIHCLIPVILTYIKIKSILLK